MTSSLVGRPAVPFELRDAQDRVHRLDGYRGRWLLLVLHRHLF
jgi:peroxiredoxin